MTEPIETLLVSTLGGADTGIHVVTLVAGMLGGLAVFLLGMDFMARAMKAVSGARMHHFLLLLTRNRFMGLLTGAVTTTVLQSSSVTTVLVVGFISAGLMSLYQAIGVILGANIGTTFTAQIIAFKVTTLAFPMIAGGFALRFVGKGKLKEHGNGILGLGLVFLGMLLMSTAMSPLRGYQPFLDWMVRLENPVYGIGLAALFTALVQSSSATTGIVIAMASSGLITLQSGIALVFGANIGTCVTAMLATVGRSREALRAAIVHVVFNVLGVILWVGFIDNLADLVTWMSPAAPQLAGADRLAAETPRQIANAHTVFNVANALLFVGFVTQLGRLAEWLVPDRPLSEGRPAFEYLDESLLHTPSLALLAGRREVVRMGEQVVRMLESCLPAIIRGTDDDLERVRAMDDVVDALYGDIVTFLGKVSQQQLGDLDTRQMVALMGIANDLESIGDIIETNLVALGRRRLEHEVQISDATTQVINDFRDHVVKALDEAVQAASEQDADAANQVKKMKRDINKMAADAARHEAMRLVADEPNRLQAYAVESDIFENLKRIYYFAKRIARHVHGIAPEADDSSVQAVTVDTE